MKNNEKEMKFNLQLFADEQGGEGTQPEGQAVDYEQEYKKQMLEIEKLKNAMSKTNSENAEYKRKEIEAKQKELEKMSDDERKAKEFEDLMESNKKLQAQLEEIQIEKEFLGCGFTKEEFDAMKDKKFSISAWGELFKAKTDELTKSITANLMKQTTPIENLGNGTTDGSKTKSDFAKRQELLAKKDTSGKVEL